MLATLARRPFAAARLSPLARSIAGTGRGPCGLLQALFSCWLSSFPRWPSHGASDRCALFARRILRAAVVVLLLYGVTIFVFFQPIAHYALPLIVDVYSPARDSWTNLAFIRCVAVQLVLAGRVRLCRARLCASASGAGSSRRGGARLRVRLARLSRQLPHSGKGLDQSRLSRRGA